MRTEITLDGESLDPAHVWAFAHQALNPRAQFKINIAKTAAKKIDRAAAFVARVIRGPKPVYGINTGFGKFAEVVIPGHQLEELQRNLILSHSCGVGERLPRDIVMAMWILRLNTICRGHSGVRRETIDRIILLLEAGILAEIPSRGSVGASGDLAPSAHATLTLLGEGSCSLPTEIGFEVIQASDALRLLGIEPWVLGPKEGLSLINGTQLTTALAAKAWAEGANLVKHANLAAAFSIEGLRGSHAIISPLVLKSRQHPGTLACGREIAAWLKGVSKIRQSHEDCEQVQDPYSLRCAPQVHVAVLDELDRAREVLFREMNSSTDNPLLFPEENISLSGGNFHAIYTARTADTLAATLTVLGSISERRIALAMGPKSSKLPAFLIKKGGLHSGFMMAQVTAAALVSESKSLSFPASVDSIPTSEDREDHVSMGPAAGHKAVMVAEHIRSVIAIEILASAQAIDLLRPLQTTPRLERAHSILRASVPRLDRDRILSEDFRLVADLIEKGDLLA
jgi:histidine ammonia-lyase